MKTKENRGISRSGHAAGFPGITLVTPCYNHAAFIEAALLSVLDQSYPNLEYVVVDGGSTDGSEKIIGSYGEHLARWTSRPDAGQYHAINDGFADTTGEIMGWLNSDDMLHPNALWTVAEIFSTLPEVEWITGIPTLFDAAGRTVTVAVKDSKLRWSRRRLLSGDYRWIQQESVFWRRRLWERSGGYLDTRYALAADFELWIRFSRHAQLHSATVLVGGFRMSSSSQRSREQRAAYLREVAEILRAEPRSARDRLALAGLALCSGHVAKLPFIGPVFGPLRAGLMRFPPMIEYDHRLGRFALRRRRLPAL